MNEGMFGTACCFFGGGFWVLWMVVLRGLFIVQPRQAHVLLYFGKYSRTIADPGIHWAFPIGLARKIGSARDVAYNTPTVTVVEAHGKPIQVSAVVVYRVVNAQRALIDVQGYQHFVANQTSAVLKNVCSRYPYEADHVHEPSLKAESDEILEALRSHLQEQVNPAGVQVVLVRLNDLTYSPDIAQAMLLRQQAQALVDARRTLVDGALSITSETLARLHQEGVPLSEAGRVRLATNLALLLCAGEKTEQQHHSRARS